ncbi:MAG: RNase adapter RapZ [Burkholderiales bacterium]|nr:RNase adapter RapZ [Burkholderiales bacterium]
MQLVLVSGLSGSGKSVVLKALEDDGYYCVDNLPATLLDDVARFLADAGHARVAVSVDARSAALASLPARVAALRAQGLDCRLLFLEASSQTLLRRFSETRRRHPLLGPTRTLGEAIEHERSLLAEVAELGERIDTSGVQAQDLRRWVRSLLALSGSAPLLLIESFAFRDGLPIDADWVADVRMLPNPHYVDALRPLTGLDAPVAEFLSREAAVQRMVADLRALIERWLPDILRENRSTLTIAIGCTGGRHRSVYVAERLAEALRAHAQVLVRHRGLARPASAE